MSSSSSLSSLSSSCRAPAAKRARTGGDEDEWEDEDGSGGGVTWDPACEVEGDAAVFGVLARTCRGWRLTLEEWQAAHRAMHDLCDNAQSAVARSTAWATILGTIEDSELPALETWAQKKREQKEGQAPHAAYVWTLPAHIGALVDARKPRPDMLCRLLGVLERLAVCAPAAACRYLLFLAQCRVPPLLQEQTVRVAFALLPLCRADALAPLSRVVFQNTAASSFCQVDDIEDWRAVLVARFAPHTRVLCAVAEACFDTLARNGFMLDMYAASLDVSAAWSPADLHIVLLCLGNLEAFVFPFPTARIRDVLCAAVLRRAAVLDQLRQLLRHCGPAITPLEDSTGANTTNAPSTKNRNKNSNKGPVDGCRPLSLRAVFRLCDVLDDTVAAAAAAPASFGGGGGGGSGASTTAHAQMERTRLSMAKWSSTALFTLFAEQPALRANIIDFALRKLIETNPHSVDSADSFLSSVMEARPELFEVHRRRIARWFFANASYCPLRAADVLASIVASSATPRTFRHVTRLLYAPHLQSNQCAIVMACALLSQEPRPPLLKHRIRLLRSLLFMATHSPDVLVSRESFHGISVLSEVLPPDEYAMVQECLASFTSLYVAPLTQALPQCDGTGGSASGSAIVAPENVVLSQLSAPTTRAVEAGRSVALPPFLECLYRYQNPDRQSSSLDTVSVERLIRTISQSGDGLFSTFFALEPFRFSLSLICASAVAGVPAVLGMQSITSVAISFASESAMTTVPGEHSSAKDQSMCHLALQCASLSRAVRLNLIQAGTTAMTFVVQSVHMLVLGVHTFPDSEQEQRKFGAIVIEPMTAITCLPYLDACSSTSTGRQISNKILAFVPCLTTFFALLFDALVFFFFYQTVREVLCLNS